MKAVTKHSADERVVYRVRDLPEPQRTGPTDVKIRIGRVGVCTSDIHALHGVMHVPEGNIVGHEYSGTVVEVGPAVEGLAVGDRVVGELAVGKCGQCRFCRAGRYEFCTAKRPPGWASPGVYAEYAVMPADLLHRVPAGVSLDVAALAEPVAICVYGCIERAGIDPEARTVIYGLGSIGLITLVVLRDLGVREIICVGPTRHGRARLELAEALGASQVLAAEEDVPGRLADAPVDCVVDCSGAPAAINQGLHLLRKDGLLVGLGIAAADEIPFAFNAGVLSALRVVFSCTSSHSAWQRTLGILQRRGDDLARLITHQFPLENWADAYAALETRQAVKALLVP